MKSKIIFMATFKNKLCHFERSDALHREAEKSIKNRFLDSQSSLGMTIIISCLTYILLFSTSQIFADDLYENFKNPADGVRPIAKWDWSAKMNEKEIVKQLDIFKQAGFGGVEIYPLKNIKAEMLKLAADEAKKRGMSVDLSIGPDLASPDLKAGEGIQIIALGKKTFKGPTTFKGNIKDLIKLADEKQNISSDPKRKIMFLRLIKMGLLGFDPGNDLLDNIQPNGKIEFGMPDNNDYILYIGVWHENYVKSSDGQLLDTFNKKAVENYFINRLKPVVGNSIRAISCQALQLHGANWTADFNEQFTQRRGYDIAPYLPMILDFDFPIEKTRVYDTIRRTRYDYCLTLSELFRENFVRTFTGFCRDNKVLSRLEPPAYPFLTDIYNDFNIADIPCGEVPAISGQISRDPNFIAEINSRAMNKIASSASHLAGKSITACETYIPSDLSLESMKTADDMTFISGINQSIFDMPLKSITSRTDLKNFCDRNARLSGLFQNSRHQAKIAILLSFNDLWSDYGPSRDRLPKSNGYLFALWKALNNNGCDADYIDENDIQAADYNDGKLHIGRQTYDLLMIPDVFSISFPTAKVLRFYAQAGGKMAIIGQPPKTSPGFKDLVERSVPVSITMDYVRQNDPNRVAFIKTPVNDLNILSIWAAEMINYFKIKPDVRILPPGGPMISVSTNLFVVHYLADGRDIFYLINADKTATAKFQAQFDTGDKIPWLWEPETGNRSVFDYGENKNLLNINIKSSGSILIVFEKEQNNK